MNYEYKDGNKKCLWKFMGLLVDVYVKKLSDDDFI